MQQRHVVSIFCSLMVFGSAAMAAQMQKEEFVEPRTPIEIDVQKLEAHVSISKDGMKRYKGSDAVCGLNRPSRRAITGSGTAFLQERPLRILENESADLNLAPPVEVGSGMGHFRGALSWLDGWRQIKISNQVTRSSGSQIVDLGMTDVMRKFTPKHDKDEDCSFWGDCDLCSVSDWTEQIEKDTLSGHLDLTYEVPVGVKFIRIEVLEATGVFMQNDPNKQASRVALVGGIHPYLSYVAPTYAWYDKAEDNRIRIRFAFNTYSMGAGRDGLTVESKLKVKIRPIVLPRNVGLDEVFEGVMEKLTDKNASEDQLVVDLGALISQFAVGQLGLSTMQVLDKKSLREIREIQSELFDFAISETKDHAGFTPTTKAMAAVLATSIAKHLSEKLLNICRLKTKELLLTKQSVELPGYVYLTFYVQRVVQRLENLNVRELYNFAEILGQIESSGMNFQQVAADAQVMARLADTHDIYVNMVSASRQPLRTSEGEMSNLFNELGSVLKSDGNDQTILSLLNAGQGLERKIQTKINVVKRSTTLNPTAAPFTAEKVWQDVLALEKNVKSTLKALARFSQDSMFSETTKTGIHESMFEIFKGVNLREVDFPAGTEVHTFYQPIFEHFFSREVIERVNMEAKLCLQGELK